MRDKYDEIARRAGYTDLEAVLADPALTAAGVATVMGRSTRWAHMQRQRRGLGHLGHMRRRQRAARARAELAARKDARSRAKRVPPLLRGRLQQLYAAGDDLELAAALVKARVAGYTLQALGETLGVTRETVRLRIAGRVGASREMIAAALYEDGMTLREIAQALGVNNTTVGRYLRGKVETRRRGPRGHAVTDQQIIDLRDVERLGWREIGRRLRMSESGVRTRYMQATTGARWR